MSWSLRAYTIRELSLVGELLIKSVARGLEHSMGRAGRSHDVAAQNLHLLQVGLEPEIEPVPHDVRTLGAPKGSNRETIPLCVVAHSCFVHSVR